MDFAVWVKLDDDIERRVHVDDVLALEMPFDPELHGGNVLVDYGDQEIWGYLAKSELWKVEKYRPQVVERTAGIRVAARAVRRDPLLEWLAKDYDDDAELPTSILPVLLRNWGASA